MNNLPKHAFTALWIVRARRVHRLFSVYFLSFNPSLTQNPNDLPFKLLWSAIVHISQCLRSIFSNSRMIVSINWQIWKHITKQIFHQALSFSICGLKDIIIAPSISYSSFDCRTLSWCVQYEFVTAGKVLLFKRTKGEKYNFSLQSQKHSTMAEISTKYPHEDGHVKILPPQFGMFKKHEKKV